MELRIAEEKDAALWDDTVKNSPHATLFHMWKALKIAEKHTRISMPLGSGKGKLYPLVGFKGEDCVAVFPIFHYEGFIGYVLSPPSGLWLTRLGPLVRNYAELKQHKREAILKELIFSVDDFIRKELKPASIKIRTPPLLEDPRAFMWRGYNVKPMFDYRLDLTVPEEQIFERLPKKLRDNIKKGGKSGMVVAEGGKEQIKLILDSMCDRLSQQGMGFSAPEGFISELREEFRDLRVFCAKLDGKTLSGDIVTSFGDTMSMWIGGPKIPDMPYFTNDFIMWKVAMKAKEEGLKYLENQWANDRRLCVYKSKYDMRPSMYFSAEKNKIVYNAMKRIKSAYEHF